MKNIINYYDGNFLDDKSPTFSLYFSVYINIMMIHECYATVNVIIRLETFLLPGWSAPGPVAGQKKHPKLKTVQKIEMAFLLHSFKMSIFPCGTVFAGFK